MQEDDTSKAGGGGGGAATSSLSGLGARVRGGGGAPPPSLNENERQMENSRKDKIAGLQFFSDPILLGYDLHNSQHDDF